MSSRSNPSDSWSAPSPRKTTTTSASAAVCTASSRRVAASPDPSVVKPGANVTAPDPACARISSSGTSRRVGFTCELPPPW